MKHKQSTLQAGIVGLPRTFGVGHVHELRVGGWKHDQKINSIGKETCLRRRRSGASYPSLDELVLDRWKCGTTTTFVISQHRILRLMIFPEDTGLFVKRERILRIY